MYLVEFSSQAEKDKRRLKAARLEQKAKYLLNILVNNPFQTPPPYEKLLGDLRGNFSRRINIQHRLVYSVYENIDAVKDISNNVYDGIVRVKRTWTHYE